MGGAVKSVVKQAKKVIGGGGAAQAVAKVSPVAKAVADVKPAEVVGAKAATQALAPKMAMQAPAVDGATSLLNKRNKGYREMQKKGTLG